MGDRGLLLTTFPINTRTQNHFVLQCLEERVGRNVDDAVSGQFEDKLSPDYSVW